MTIKKLNESLLKNGKEKNKTTGKAVFEIPINMIEDFPGHPFKVRMDENMMEMVNSIKQYGVLVPALIRPRQNGNYEMVSGHRRKYASKLAGAESLPCIVKNLSKDEAIIIMVDSNLQREKVLPSEKAFAYKMKLDAIKRKRELQKEKGVPTEHLLEGKSREVLANNSPDSNTQIQRYIRLTNLSQSILDMVDEGKIAMRPAIEISFLTKNEQEILSDTIVQEDCTPSHAQTIKMRKFSQDGKLIKEVIQSILQEKKPNQKEQFSIPQERISKYFPSGTSKEKMQDTIVKALEYYRNWQRSVK